MRFIDIGIVSPEEGPIIEKKAFSEFNERTLLIYSRNEPTVSVGAYTDIDKNVDTEYAKENNIKIIRRMSGGSAIYYNPGQITFSLIVEKECFSSKEESYKIICGYLIKTLAHLGIEATYKPKNDVLVNDRKISGCAQYRGRSVILHHGSLIMKLDMTATDRVLKPVKDRSYSGLTSIEENIGRVPDRKEILEAFRCGFSELN